MNSDAVEVDHDPQLLVFAGEKKADSMNMLLIIWILNKYLILNYMSSGEALSMLCWARAGAARPRCCPASSGGRASSPGTLLYSKSAPGTAASWASCHRTSASSRSSPSSGRPSGAVAAETG